MKRVTTLQEIKAYADELVAKFTPQKVILFGSYARGEACEDSDVDLLVIMNCADKPVRQALEIRRSLRKAFPLDLVVRSPEQINNRLASGDPFIQEAIATGQTLYERN
ncbi:MAG: nucleotidyltransferase domain-containing protein [Opitutales bacterium]